MIPYILIYHLYQQYEWATKYHLSSELGLTQQRAVELAALESDLFSALVTCNRWEGIDAAGKKVAEGPLLQVGFLSGEIQNIKYCALLRQVSDELVERPSVRYIHGTTEGISSNGVPTTAYLNSIEQYGEGLAPLGVVDSDGNAAVGAVFRQFTRRRRLRRLL